MAEREELRLLRADLADLPERQRAALVLRELNGLTHVEIGQVLDLSPSGGQTGAVRRPHRAFDAREGRGAGVRRRCAASCPTATAACCAGAVRAHLRSCAAAAASAPSSRASAGAAAAGPAAAGGGAASLLSQLLGGTAAKLLTCVVIAGGGTTVAAIEYQHSRAPSRAPARETR